MTAAYDYNKQEWIEDAEDARAEAIRQIEQEIDILRKQKWAEDYLAFCGSTDTPAQAIAKLKTSLKELKDTVAKEAERNMWDKHYNNIGYK